MTEIEACRLIEAASRGFAEGLLRALDSRVTCVNGDGASCQPVPKTYDDQPASEKTDDVNFHRWLTGDDLAEQERDDADPVAGGHRFPEELDRAARAMTGDLPAGHYDPQDESEARPRWLSPE